MEEKIVDTSFYYLDEEYEELISDTNALDEWLEEYEESKATQETKIKES